ncbi:S8 family serine peptidase [Paraglaciecola sp. 20A4]|uniref:S8 family serine peptidase n=1 Tax=Paraglaciecola sp. 20A4 TaxID=2687288 RepID=UPI001407466E|nr:S8 family serine peptidase [Paraglaciecola sp. 20A4]
MKNTFITTVALSALAAISSPALATDTVRLVVTPKHTSAKGFVSQASVSQGGCVSTPRGTADWCIGSSNSSNSIRVQATSVSGAEKSIVNLESHGYSAEEVAKLLSDDGRFGTVEADVRVSTAGSPQVKSQSLADGAPNDPGFEIYQEDYLGARDKYSAGMNVVPEWKTHNGFRDGETVDVVVMDSSFFINDDVPYYSGASFVTTGDEVSKDDFAPAQSALDAGEGVCNGHGLGVASTISALTDNGIGSAGIIDNARIHVARVMNCGDGYLSDTARAMDWLAGDEIEGVTPYQGGVGVVNMSLAGESETCPFYMQESIDKLKALGWTLVAAAGNVTDDSNNYAPGNCEGVINVGSVDLDGTLTYFSNTGTSIDLMAAGVNIAAACSASTESNSECYWDGTSFSSPLVAGLFAAAKSVTGADSEILETAFKTTAYGNTVTGCVDGHCGSGIPDLTAAISFAQKSMSGELNTISFALGENDNCEQSWFIDNFGGSIPMCSLYKVTFFSGNISEGTHYELVSVDASQTFETGSIDVQGVFTKAEMYLPAIDVVNNKYGVRVCDASGCDDEIFDMNVSGAQEEDRPAACKE